MSSFARVYEVDCRRLAEDRLFVTGGHEWRYADAAQPGRDARPVGTDRRVMAFCA
jgi:hypothetical protein